MGGGIEVSNAGEKKKRSLQVGDGLCNIQTEVGFKPSSCHPVIPDETSQNLGLEVEDDFDTPAVRKVGTGTEFLG